MTKCEWTNQRGSFLPVTCSRRATYAVTMSDGEQTPMCLTHARRDLSLVAIFIKK